MKALFNLFSSLSLTTVWSKIKVGLLIAAVSFMAWQGLQMNSLQQDVTKLETVQTSLQLQVQQMSVDYSLLRDNYKNYSQTSEQYLKSVENLNSKSTDLEKSFSELESKAAKAYKKADTALSLQTGTTPEVNHETNATPALKSLGRGSSDGVDRSDAEWRKLLDNTYCSVYPTDTRCTQ
ncbi:hypothetical protein [Pseudomonas sp. P8_250]|uniref:hypothetical protein n=1 Tax=Pseudomonas sp. P8_250 TaxID=3043446 RepID=UPI002A36F8DF|nr:hypothetical protein [Pseudomonas sp. P8_250]MDX9668754.1 hypothetical protein [Pseudomonas sp. P8_250]